MKFGTRLYGVDPDELLVMAQLAESMGYDSLWRGDHMLIPRRPAQSYPYEEHSSSSELVSTSPILDCCSVLNFLAAATNEIKLATGVVVLPIRNVFEFGRQMMTLDRLSGGRAIAGIGVGWLADEFALLGSEFSDRGSRTTEMVEVLRALWDQASPEYHGQHYDFTGVDFEPKPSSSRLPIVVGGESRAALRRAARHADGWYGHHGSLDALVAKLDFIGEERCRASRDEMPFEVTIRVLPDVGRAHIEELHELGVDRVVLQVGSFGVPRRWDALAALEDFRARVMEQFRDA